MDDLSITSGLTNRLWRVALWGTVIAILIAPLIAMQFTGEVHWTLFDFAVATILLSATALAIELAIRVIGRPTWCVAAVLAILLFALVECWRGREPDLPGISQAVRMQLY